jgi:hypothetical protein
MTVVFEHKYIVMYSRGPRKRVVTMSQDKLRHSAGVRSEEPEVEEGPRQLDSTPCQPAPQIEIS